MVTRVHRERVFAETPLQRRYQLTDSRGIFRSQMDESFTGRCIARQIGDVTKRVVGLYADRVF